MKSVSASAPRIGFDRFIALDWATAAMRVRAGSVPREDLNVILDGAGMTLSARKKTVTLLNRLWLAPRPELAEFADRGSAIGQTSIGTSDAALCWGMSIAAYPFFAKVAELVGRLTALQGDCGASEVHRRMAEIYGEREGTLRMTNMVLQTQADWGAIERTDRGRRIIRKPTIKLADDALVGWLIEAALRFAGRAVPVASVGSMTVLYPFELDRPVAYLVSRAPALELRYQGPGEQLVDIKERL